VDATAQPDELAGIGAVEAVDGEVAQERAWAGERAVGQSLAKGLARSLLLIGRRPSQSGQPSGTERDSVGRRGLPGRLLLVFPAGLGLGVHGRPVVCWVFGWAAVSRDDGIKRSSTFVPSRSAHGPFLPYSGPTSSAHCWTPPPDSARAEA